MKKTNVDKDDVTKTNDVDKGDVEREINKKKKKKKIDSEDGAIEGKKGIDDGGILRRDGEGEVMEEDVDRKKKKKRKERGKRKEGLGVGSDHCVENECDAPLGDNEIRHNGGKKRKEGEEVLGERVAVEKVEKRRKKKGEKIRDKGDVSATAQRDLIQGKAMDTERENGKGVEISGEGCNKEVIEKVERKKRKREKGKSMDDLDAGGQDISTNNLESAEGNSCSTENQLQDSDMKSNSRGKMKEANLDKSGSDNPKAKNGKKKVRFSGHVEVFPLSADSNYQKNKGGDDKLVRGKRYSREEDEIIKAAVYKYIAEHALGEDGLDMVLNCGSHPEVKGCWKHIAKALPHRPQISIYDRAQKVFRRGNSRKWTEDDYELIKKLQEVHGNQWNLLAEELGRYRTHVRSTWNRIKLSNRKIGKWSQEEYQALFDLVNADLRLKLSSEKKSKHGMLRDDIHWSAISDKLSTRCNAVCCMKWYRQLTSPMVAEGLWADADDYRLVNTLFSLDASCMEDVDWDNLLNHRSGDVCRKRWNQMVLHIGQHGSKSFAEQVEILARRYCPDLLEVREAWDSKPVVA